MAWATDAIGGSIWGVGGVASDGKNPFITTGNTYNPHTWGGGEAVIRFLPGPIFTGNPSDYWAPLNWRDLDIPWDFDLGGCGPLLVDVSGATPSHLVVALGKDTQGYLLDRDNLGGSVCLWHRPTYLPATASSRQPSRIERTKASMWLSAQARRSFQLSALLQQIRPRL